MSDSTNPFEKPPKKDQTVDDIFAASREALSELKKEEIKAKGYALTPEERVKLQKERKALAWEKENLWSKEGVFVTQEEKDKVEQRIVAIDQELEQDEPKQMHEIELKIVQSENQPPVPAKPKAKSPVDEYREKLMHGNPEEVEKRKRAMYEGNPAEVERRRQALFGDKEKEK